MASRMCRLGVVLLLFSLAYASDVFDRILGENKSCTDVCEKTFSPHTYEKNSHHESCRRGCRFYSIMEFVHDHQEANATQAECISCCKEAYNETGAFSACALGCRSQQPFEINKSGDEEPSIHLLYPLLYVHGIYSNMIDKAYHHMHVSWSFYMQADDSKLIVVRSQPQIYTDFMDAQDLDDYRGMLGDDKTATYMETNIEPIDGGATPMLKHSQMRSAHSLEEGLALDAEDRGGNSDWLTCIARRSGIPRLLLCMMILFCAMVMIWLCLTAAVTAPDQRVHAPQEKLSINGDLEYLREGGQAKPYQLLLTQERVEAAPLPIKIKVQRI